MNFTWQLSTYERDNATIDEFCEDMFPMRSVLTVMSRHNGTFSENNLRTESNIWSQVPEWDRYLDILTDRHV
jgi:hypothetical protein